MACYRRVIVVVMGQRRLRAPQRWFLLSEPGASAVTCQRVNRWRGQAVRSCACLDASLPSPVPFTRPSTPLLDYLLYSHPPRPRPLPRRLLFSAACRRRRPLDIYPSSLSTLPLCSTARAGERGQRPSIPSWPPCASQQASTPGPRSHALNACEPNCASPHLPRIESGEADLAWRHRPPAEVRSRLLAPTHSRLLAVLDD